MSAWQACSGQTGHLFPALRSAGVSSERIPRSKQGFSALARRLFDCPRDTHGFHSRNEVFDK
jgi:hypothetical protein